MQAASTLQSLQLTALPAGSPAGLRCPCSVPAGLLYVVLSCFCTCLTALTAERCSALFMNPASVPEAEICLGRLLLLLGPL